MTVCTCIWLSLSELVNFFLSVVIALILSTCCRIHVYVLVHNISLLLNRRCSRLFICCWYLKNHLDRCVIVDQLTRRDNTGINSRYTRMHTNKIVDVNSYIHSTFASILNVSVTWFKFYYLADWLTHLLMVLFIVPIDIISCTGKSTMSRNL